MTGDPKKLKRLLSNAPFAIMDGGMGTQIEDRGFAVRTALWSSAALLSDEGRTINDAVHADYQRAGAELLISNTHNASLAFSSAFLKETGVAIPGFDTPRKLQALVIWEALQSMRRALGEAPREVIAGCIGSPEPPYIKSGTLTAEKIAQRLSTQVQMLAASSIDLLLFEMVSTKGELAGIELAMEELREKHPDLPVGVGFPCDESGKTHGGVAMRDVVRMLGKVKPDLYFIQCTRYDLVERPLSELLDALGHSKNVGAYGNDGRVWKDRAWHGERISPELYAEHAARWVQLGASIVGGCCGTGPEHVAALARLRDEMRR